MTIVLVLLWSCRVFVLRNGSHMSKRNIARKLWRPERPVPLRLLLYVSSVLYNSLDLSHQVLFPISRKPFALNVLVLDNMWLLPERPELRHRLQSMKPPSPRLPLLLVLSTLAFPYPGGRTRKPMLSVP